MEKVLQKQCSQWITVCMTIVTCQTAGAQDAAPDSLAGRFSSFVEGRPSETIYLQTGKGIYETGEDLWFKAYVFETQTLALSDESRTLYLQMIGDNGDSVVWQEKYPVENGIVAGHVYVQDSLPGGNYRLEAYTRHSFYADSMEINAVRKVKIVRNINKSERNAFSVKNSSLRFETFPEGGNPVAGIPVRLAFKATDGQGYPVEVHGALYENDVQLAEIQSIHAGMGSVRFTPVQDGTYCIKLENGDSYPLPEIYAQGMTLRLSGRDSSCLEFAVSQRGGQPRMFYLTGQLRGTVCCVARGMLHGTV
jgi:hypothetical protein